MDKLIELGAVSTETKGTIENYTEGGTIPCSWANDGTCDG
jgi:hypothetical protein